MNADAILTAMLDASGGADRWAGLTSRRYRGHALRHGQPDYGCTITIRLPHDYRRDVQYAAGTLIQTTNGTDCWIAENGVARRGTVAEAAKFADSRDKEIPFLDYATKGFTLTCDSQEPFFDRPCHRLVLTQRNGNVRELLVDTETHRWAGERLITNGGTTVVVQRFLDDRYVSGLTFAHQIDRYYGDEVVAQLFIDEMAVNEMLDDALFEQP